MKKLILVLAIALIASPVMALNVYLEKQAGVNVVDVKYSDADAANLPRAFALTLNITGGTFDSFVAGSYKVGESTSSSKGFGIYPATIVIDSAGVVTNDGTPLAAAGDPGTAGTGFGTSSIILEFGSLYDASVSGNAPLTSGTLCSINYTKGTATDITMEDEDTYRGGLVLEDGTLGEVTASLTLGGTPPSPATNGTPVANVTTATGALTTDLGWTAGAGATSYDVYFGTIDPPPFASNVAGTSFDTGTMVQGKVYYAKVVAKNVDGEAAALAWSFNTDCLIGGAAGTGEYNKWVEYGKPSCWCFKKQCRGDADGKNTTLKPVMNPDLVIFKAAFNKSKAEVKTIVVSEMPGICADFDHKDTTLKPVMNPDLVIFKEYFNDSNASVPQCDAAPVITGPVNFWTN
jgi:hypothetical protein